MAAAAGDSGGGGGGLAFAAVFSDDNASASAPAQLRAVNAEAAAVDAAPLPLNATELRLMPSPDLSAEPAMNVAAAAAGSPQAAVMADAMNAVAAVHVADIAVNPKTPIPMARLEQSPGYRRRRILRLDE